MSTSTPSAPRTPSLRLTSLDQFRGYTMFGMLLVNYLGAYKLVCPYVLRHHHDYCSYADTIMPQFLFAAGFAMRLSLGRRLEAGGKMPWGRAIRRILGLALVAIVWYSICGLEGIIKKFSTDPPAFVLYVLFKRELFQTLLHIAATSLWILPVITASWKVRVSYAIGSSLLHILLSWWFNFTWVYGPHSGVDGGPLGFLTWSVPALCGTLACDVVRTKGARAALQIALAGIGVMLLGWGMSMGTVLYNVHDEETASADPATMSSAIPDPEPPKEEKKSDEDDHANQDPIPPEKPKLKPEPEPEFKELDPKKFAPDPVFPTMERIKAWDGSIVEAPFVPPPKAKFRRWNYWMMSQRGGTLSYTTFAAGVSLVIYALFLWLCDGRNLRLGFFRTLGTNSLAAYILHDIAGWIISPYFDEKSSSTVLTMTGFACFTLFVYGICRLFERLGWYIRV